MSSTHKQAIVYEYLQCAQDPIYFIKKYCYIQHPTRGRILFHLYPFQEKVLKLFQENDYAIINKGRQLGVSTLVAGYSLWLMLFHEDKNILCIATKQSTAKNMITKVRFAFEHLPAWLNKANGKYITKENNKHSLILNNGSQIKAVAATEDAGRSEALSLLILDECLKGDVKVKLRHKHTGEVFNTTLESLYNEYCNR